MIKVYIADDHSLIREGIKRLIEKENDLSFLGETSNPFEVIDYIRENKCDVVILDISMPGKSGLDVLKELRVADPDVKVLMMTMMPEEQFAKRALKAGAAGYLTKDNAADEVVTAIRRIAGGRKYISQSLAEKLAEDIDTTKQKEPYETLSDREFQILKFIAIGKSQIDISEELSISVSTVNTYRARILEKLNLHSNADLIHFAYQNKLLE